MAPKSWRFWRRSSGVGDRCRRFPRAGRIARPVFLPPIIRVMIDELAAEFETEFMTDRAVIVDPRVGGTLNESTYAVEYDDDQVVYQGPCQLFDLRRGRSASNEIEISDHGIKVPADAEGLRVGQICTVYRGENDEIDAAEFTVDRVSVRTHRASVRLEVSRRVQRPGEGGR